MKIIIGAVITAPPFSPGMAWNWMHLATGMQRLGHEVYYVEQVARDWCFDPSGQRCSYDKSENRRLFWSIMNRFGLGERACQVFNGGEASSGMSMDALARVAKDADFLINQSGHVTLDAVLGNVRRRVYVDQDPVFTQLWRAEYGKDLNLAAHDVFLTVGANIGTPHTPIPDCGITWHHTLPPVVPDLWPFEVNPTCERFTTVATWYDYSELCYRGEWYGTKSEELRRFANLPNAAKQVCEVTLKTFSDRDAADIECLRRGGWKVERASAAADLDRYQRYINASRAEIGIAKNAYVKSRSGWFSDRSAHYLAAGRPVLAQSTGFERCLPTGEGLLTFTDQDEAVEGIRRINADYETHCRAARAFAEEHLHYEKVLPPMLAACTQAPQPIASIGA